LYFSLIIIQKQFKIYAMILDEDNQKTDCEITELTTHAIKGSTNWMIFIGIYFSLIIFPILYLLYGIVVFDVKINFVSILIPSLIVLLFIISNVLLLQKAFKFKTFCKFELMSDFESAIKIQKQYWLVLSIMMILVLARILFNILLSLKGIEP
jgi:hypothetical protein